MPRYCIAEDWGRYQRRQHQKATEQQQQAEEAEQPRPKKRKVRVSYGRHKKGLKRLCNLLELDGRRESLYLILDANSEKDPGCPACRPLFRTFSQACKPNRKKRKKKEPVVSEDSEEDAEDIEEEGSEEEGSVEEGSEEEGSEEEGSEEEDAETEKAEKPPEDEDRPKPQRYPNTELLADISTMFTEIADHPKFAEESMLAVVRLIGLLRVVEGKTKGEQDYFDVLAEYIQAPFKRLIADHQQQEEQTEKDSKGWEGANQEVDSLFDY